MTKKKTLVPIKYTSRDFSSIKEELVGHAKKYYPDTYKDFSEASFGSLMTDMVAYVGDVLSFYLDYQANESFLDTSVEYDNIIRHGRRSGYKFNSSPSSFGIATFYVSVPADTFGTGVDIRYLPVLRRGSTFSSEGNSVFTLNEDVDFSDVSNEIVVATVDETTGVPTTYAVRAFGTVISGDTFVDTVSVGNLERFLRVPLAGENIAEVIDVVDSEGHTWYETEYLSQNVIFVPVQNREKTNENSPNAIMKAMAIPRRFVTEQERETTYLQFGYGSETELNMETLKDPSAVILQVHGKNYVTDKSFDPSVLLETDKYGVSPANTTLTITYRLNSTENVNVAAGRLTQVIRPGFIFPTNAIDVSLVDTVINSLEVNNEKSITGDVTLPSTKELKRRIGDSYAAQNRAVTEQDYKAIIYRMPSKFGSVKRCSVTRDDDDIRRGLNIYTVSEDSDNSLIQTNMSIKKNLKTWLNQYKMITDTIDILDARIVNLGITFLLASEASVNKSELLDLATRALRDEFLVKADIGESFDIAKIYKILNAVPGVVDTLDVELKVKTGGIYSDNSFDVEEYISQNGRYVLCPENTVFEIKYPFSDLGGTIV